MATREKLDVKSCTFTVRFVRDETVDLEDDMPWQTCYPDGDECDAFETEAEAREYAESQTADAIQDERDRIESEYEDALETEREEEKDALISALTDHIGDMELDALRRLAKRLRVTANA